jgi:hypothetical protein
MGVVTTDITVGNHSFDKGRSISALHFRRFSLFVIQNRWKIHVIFVSGVVLGLAPTSSDVLAILGVLCE